MGEQLRRRPRHEASLETLTRLEPVTTLDWLDGARLRVVAVHPEPLLVGSDVAKALGYADATHALRTVPERFCGPLQTLEGSAGARSVSTLTLDGLIWLTMRGNKPEHDAFREWAIRQVRNLMEGKPTTSPSGVQMQLPVHEVAAQVEQLAGRVTALEGRRTLTAADAATELKLARADDLRSSAELRRARAQVLLAKLKATEEKRARKEARAVYVAEAHPRREEILKWAAEQTVVPSTQEIIKALGLPPHRAEEMRIAALMQSAGYQRKQVPIDGHMRWTWQRRGDA